MANPSGFHVNVSSVASRDIAEILDWTFETFGEDAFLRYDGLITQAFRDIGEDPERPGTLQPWGFSAGVHVYHLSFSRERARSPLGIVRNPRHFVAYRIQGPVVNILRILHDARDLARHLPEDA